MFKFIGVILVLGFAISSCGDLRGNNEKTATQWAEALGYKVDKVLCESYDTNNTGYVACTIKVVGSNELLFVECPSILKQALEPNCRQQRVAK